MNKFLLSLLAAMAIISSAYAAEPLPGDACSAANNLQFTSGPEVSGGGGHAMLCEGGTWKSILSFNSTAGLTKLGSQTCATNEILKFNGTTWVCAADASGISGLPTLTSANIWVGNASNAATAVAMSGDATLSNAGVLTIGSNAVGSAEITDASVALADLAGNSVNASKIVDASIALADLSATGTASATTYLRGDNTWTTVPSGADNLGNHTATQALNMGGFNVTGAARILSGGSSPNPVSGIDTFGLMASGSFGAGIGLQDGTGDFGLWLDGTGTNARFGFGASLGPLTTAMSLTNTGTVSATTFSGSGASLTALNASNLSSGTVAPARLGTGTANSSVFLRGDGAWAAIAGDNLGAGGTTTGQITINNGSPTIFLQDTDQRSAMLHNNGNQFYLLTGSGINSGTWALNGGAWPIQVDLTSDNITLGGQVNLVEGALSLGTQGVTSSAGTVIDGSGGWHRTYGATGWYNGTFGGGWHMSDATWIRSYGGKWVYTDTGMRADGNGVRTTQVCDVNGANCRTPAQLAAGGGGGITDQTTTTCTTAFWGYSTCSTPACPAGYFRSGCSAVGGAGGGSGASPSGSNACLCTNGTTDGVQTSCYTYCMK